MAKIKEEGPKVVLLCVDGYENGVLSGCFYRQSLQSGCEIRSLAQFLVGVERTIEEKHRASCTERLKRAFFPRKESCWELPDRCGLQKGRLATFEVRILFCCHTSWQGTVSWLEEGREEIFRSVLELVLLLDSALGNALDPGKNRAQVGPAAGADEGGPAPAGAKRCDIRMKPKETAKKGFGRE